ncbi:DUF757-domain-containing protein [Tilletiaria anomala UBC 951]|uniref:Protein PBDC1 homolog n=1 Tax=Tilletiaria anomala (strain ATCC 24038 / CBS 436.72 / UBC 951) TaxID=1037660 RepID=A0A066WCI3_TILAU|nr:DUF757-domain-containing protein [Tilletiaria anomala UBC 951]KDN48480.1 DUF757-domain-containing protein [Tilletiaria anomala UBC 951]
MSLGTFDANQAQNLPEIEKQMAVKCVEHAQTYWNLLEKIKPSTLKLTKLDDEIYTDFTQSFPEYSEESRPKSVQKIDEDEMKSAKGKERWRKFSERYEGKVADFNQGTLIRTDSSDEYTQNNTIFVLRLQFYCFEIARCRRGLNDWIWDKEQAEKAKQKGKGKK